MGQTRRAVVTARHSHRQDPSPSSAQIVPSRSGPLQGPSPSSRYSLRSMAKAKANPMPRLEKTKALASVTQLAFHALQRLVELLKHAVGGKAELAQLGA